MSQNFSLFKNKTARNLLILIPSILALLFLTNSVLAIEIVYPPVPGTEPPQVFMERIENGEIPADQALPLYIKYFYHFSLVTIGLVCFFSVISGGVLLLIAGGSIDRVKEGKERIFVGFVGAILILFSVAVANLLNPRLLIWRIVKPEIEAPPVVELPPEEESLPTYVEIPLGGLIEMVRGKTFILDRQIQVVSRLNERINRAAQYLDELLTLQCQCDTLETQNCPGGEDSTCSEAYCEGDPCEDRETIEAQIEYLNYLADQLNVQRESLLFAQSDLNLANQKLKLAEALLRDTIYPSINYDSFIAIEDKEIERIWPYERPIEGESGVIEYYCSPECNGDAPHERTPCCVLCPKRNVLLCFGNNYKCDQASLNRVYCYPPNSCETMPENECDYCNENNACCVYRCPNICPSDPSIPNSRPGQPDRTCESDPAFCWRSQSEFPSGTIQYNGQTFFIPSGGFQLRDGNTGNCWED